MTKYKLASIQVYNTAVRGRSNLLELTTLLKKYLSEFDPKIREVDIKHGPNRVGDIPHSLASISKARKMLNYKPGFNIETGLKEAVYWYWSNL
ncbi:hypothetical protein EHW67_16065 [Arenibacter aquaticus]|uniref:NAD(P)-binding domain-containing protein n=1 Tax=Arenibacter aquaticus TaxID=2489054 RepID=A0A3S0BU95_9FLAO|nr:hypothetical protein [Arenibacter aquaticus]RTE51726.1 hypothetical protein EHW67_16065 [Arenibacter aquaticus]